MKTAALTLLLTTVLCVSSIAQDQLPAEKKVTFGQNGEMYVNKDIGVYLWLSTSPDKDAPKHKLSSDSTNKYANPMYFDTEGYNTLRSPSAVNPVTKQTIYPLRDIVFEVYADGKAPVTKHTYVGGKSIYRKGILYYGGNNAGVILSATDEVSGLEKTFYSLNNKNYAPYTDTIKLDTEGEIVLKFYSTDRVGNVEEVNTKNVIIDNNAPQTEAELIGSQNNKYVSAQTVIKLKSTDNLSGVKTIYYSINGGTKRTYTSPISVKSLGENGTLSFYAVDYLNNKEELKTIGGNSEGSVSTGEGGNFEFYMDKDAPSITVEFEGAHASGKYTYVSKNTKIKVNASDQKSGVERINYSINNSNVDQVYDSGIEFSEEGIAYIRVNASDYVGNKSATITKAYFVDATAPVTKVNILKPKHKVKDTLFITSNTEISLTATDNASGVESIFYTIDKKDKMKFEQSFKVSGSGLVGISYFAIDKVGNKENNNTLEVTVDDIPPIIYHHYSASSIGTKSVRDIEYTIYPSNMKLYIAATDNESGGERIEYKINGGSTKSTNPIKGLAPGNYEVEVKAFDVLGNSSLQTITFSVEE